MDVRLSAETSLKQTLSLNQLRSLEILAMDVTELNEYMKKEYLENPMLECRGNDCSEGEGGAEEGPAPYAGISRTVTYGMSLRDAFEEAAEREIPAPGHSELKNHIQDQLPPGKYSDEEIGLFRYLTDCLDDSGYFKLSAEEVSESTGVEPERIEEALAVLRELEPCGIFAADLRGCLLKQLEHSGRTGTLLWDITENFLQEVAGGNIGKISRTLKVSTADVRKAIEELVKLSPRPINGYGRENTDYIIPDIIFRRDGEEWQISLNTGAVEDYGINDFYVAMMKEARDIELKEYFSGRLERAKQVLASIRQRKKTMLAVSRELLKRQRAFFEGRGELTALSMQSVAEGLGISTSTVSRAVKGKYIEYPAGVIAAKSLFANASVRKAACAGEEKAGGALSAESVKSLIRTLISEEDTSKPLSDRAISELLKDRGAAVSRRTVAKYREELGIKQSFDRKKDPGH